MLTFQQQWAYLRYVLRHKWFVFQEGRKLRVPVLMLLFHDWTKFLPVEWSAYVRAFYAKDGSGHYKPDPSFFAAWNHHQKRNRHHWQYWLLGLDKPDNGWTMQVMDEWKGPFILAFHNEPLVEFREAYNGDASLEQDQYEMGQQMLTALNAMRPMPMPDVDRREMLADWRGASRGRFGRDNTLDWYTKNRRHIQLHPETRAWLEEQIGFGEPQRVTNAQR